MSKTDETLNTYVIPPNFMESGTFFGGMIKVRNAIEAGVLALAAGIPVFSLSLPLTARIIILCFTAMPLALFGLIGISGESLTSFIFIFFKYLKNRRVVGSTDRGEHSAAKSVKKNGSRLSIFKEQRKGAPEKKISSLSLMMLGSAR